MQVLSERERAGEQSTKKSNMTERKSLLLFSLLAALCSACRRRWLCRHIAAACRDFAALALRDEPLVLGHQPLQQYRSGRSVRIGISGSSTEVGAVLESAFPGISGGGQGVRATAAGVGGRCSGGRRSPACAHPPGSVPPTRRCTAGCWWCPAARGSEGLEGAVAAAGMAAAAEPAVAEPAAETATAAPSRGAHEPHTSPPCTGKQRRSLPATACGHQHARGHQRAAANLTTCSM